MKTGPHTSLPFHIAKAYAIAPAKPVAKAQPAIPVEQAREAVEFQRLEIRRELTNSQRNISRLIAGVVPGGIDFSQETPQPTDRAAIPFYRHPSDQNAAATNVQLGRSLDVTG